MAKFEHHVEQLALIAEILLGVAYADGHFVDSERAKVKEILEGFTGLKDLPDGVDGRLDAFEASAFDLEAACAGLEMDPDDRRALLALVADVADADDVRMASEETYLVRVAEAIGADADDLDPLL